MKVAIVHDWLVNYGGAERVVEEILKIYPNADIFTLVHDRKKMRGHFSAAKITTSFVQKIPFATRLYTKFLSLMPKAFESFDLSQYDLVIASSSSCAKGVIVPPETPFVAYIHTPMRYAWDLYFDYYKRSGALTRFFMKAQIPKIRQWDFISSQRIDSIVCNSSYIARRVKRFWNRDSKVIFPPVGTDRLFPNGKPAEDFYVVFSRLVAYKRVDIAIEACGALKKNLIVIGSGKEEKRLKRLAEKYPGAKISFTGRISDEEVRDHLQRCRALIFCAEEDFGIIPVEAQACGRPVVAYRKGGATETVLEGETGIFFEEQNGESCGKAILRFEELDAEGKFESEKIVTHAKKFGEERFLAEFKAACDETMQKVRGGTL